MKISWNCLWFMQEYQKYNSSNSQLLFKNSILKIFEIT